MLLRIRRRERAATVEMIGTKLRSIATAARCNAIAPPPARGRSRSDSRVRAYHGTFAALEQT